MAAEPGPASYSRGARVLSAGIATTGVVTFAYFSLASYALDEEEYARISLLWSVLFVTVSVLYRPIEQLLSRTIAERRARGQAEDGPLRVALLIQAAFAAVFLLAALVLREPIRDDLFDGSGALYTILVVGVLAYGASYFARGFLAGHQQFALYGALVFVEATSRVCFALAVIVGIADGQTAVALGMAAAPFVSLVVVPLFFLRRPEPQARPAGDLTLRHGTGFAAAVLVVMLAEQTLINAAVLTVNATSDDPALAGVVFSVLLIARAPLQLFQAIQGSLLPHLAGLQAPADAERFARAVRVTVLAIAAFSLTVAVGLLAVGPPVMDVLFDIDFDYGRGGLALIALGMGFHLAAGTLNQAALARGRAGTAAVAWAIAAAGFVAWMLVPVVDDELLRTEVGYCAASAALCAMLGLVHRRTSSPS